jgi:hypothetical protein
MAFIRKRGNSYYLVHNIRRDGRVQQVHLARLGPRPRIDDRVIRSVIARHPFVQVNWDIVKERAARDTAKPIESDSEYVRKLIGELRNVHMNIADLQMPVLDVLRDQELRSQLITELRLLRGTLDVKLNPARKGNPAGIRGRY